MNEWMLSFKERSFITITIAYGKNNNKKKLHNYQFTKQFRKKKRKKNITIITKLVTLKTITISYWKNNNKKLHNYQFTKQFREKKEKNK